MYLWLKALHIIAVISWMAGMLYLPRLFVYHCAAEPGSKQSETFKVMERRLLKAIINAGDDRGLARRAVVDLADGQGRISCCRLAADKACPGDRNVGVHGFLVRWVKDFAADRNRHSQKFYRIINEIPTVLMIAIVILATVKPF